MFKLIVLTMALLSTGAIAHVDRSLEGTYLGVSQYKPFHRGPNKAATRIYLDEIEGERGSYHAVLLEYVNLLKMAPRYVSSNQLPAANKIIGYLKDITSQISIYKVVPTSDEHVFNMYNLTVDGSDIVPVQTENPRQLILDKSGDLKHPLSGAQITSNSKDQPDHIFFPKKDDDKRNGIQYGIANLVYEKVGLDSTWRKTFLPGPYLSAYGRTDDVVLNLSVDGAFQTMDFVLNPKYQDRSANRRERMFTHPESAFLVGSYQSTMPLNGMFLLSSISSEAKTDNNLEGRVGLFIDIFDATEALNQDVVELVFINPEDPKDFLMYYEHPENGEGEL
jgi:hypothetical protein